MNYRKDPRGTYRQMKLKKFEFWNGAGRSIDWGVDWPLNSDFEARSAKTGDKTNYNSKPEHKGNAVTCFLFVQLPLNPPNSVRHLFLLYKNQKKLMSDHFSLFHSFLRWLSIYLDSKKLAGLKYFACTLIRQKNGTFDIRNSKCPATSRSLDIRLCHPVLASTFVEGISTRRCRDRS